MAMHTPVRAIAIDIDTKQSVTWIFAAPDRPGWQTPDLASAASFLRR
jgi:hypothetical protein